jgi:hypothetical protein
VVAVFLLVRTKLLPMMPKVLKISLAKSSVRVMLAEPAVRPAKPEAMRLPTLLVVVRLRPK